MIWRNTTEAYGSVAKTFHWVIAVLMIGILAVGLYMTGMKLGPDKFKLYGLHKSFGITILTLATLRLLWRLTGKHPFPLPNHQTWEKILAKLTHGLLYAALFAMPLSGWIMSSATGFSVSFFGLFTLPDVVGPNDKLSHLANEFHEIAAWVVIGLIALHAAGALKHHLIDRDNTLRRWAAHLQNDFKARLDWCVNDYPHANHPPVARVRGA